MIISLMQARAHLYCRCIAFENASIDDGNYKDKREILIKKKNYHISCSGSIEGWLFITKSKFHSYRRIILWNPISDAQIKLPSHPRFYRYTPTSLVASSVPTTTKSNYVACLHYKKEFCLAFCKPSDKSWTVIENIESLELRTIEILDGKLYAVGKEALKFVMVFDIHLDNNVCKKGARRRHTYTSQRLITLHPDIKSIDFEIYRNKCCFAKWCDLSSNKECLFMVVHQESLFIMDKGFEEGVFQVLKLESCGSSNTSLKWVEITDFGDRALLLGTHNNKFITCHDKTSKLRNSIVYLLLNYKRGYNCGVFSMGDRSTKPIPSMFRGNSWIGGIEGVWFSPDPC